MQQAAAEALDPFGVAAGTVCEDQAGARGEQAVEPRLLPGGRVGDVGVDGCVCRGGAQVAGDVPQEGSAEQRGFLGRDDGLEAGLDVAGAGPWP